MDTNQVKTNANTAIQFKRFFSEGPQSEGTIEFFNIYIFFSSSNLGIEHFQVTMSTFYNVIVILNLLWLQKYNILPSYCSIQGACLHDSLHSCPTLCDLMDYNPPGSSDHGIFQAGILGWGAIAFFPGL